MKKLIRNLAVTILICFLAVAVSCLLFLPASYSAGSRADEALTSDDAVTVSYGENYILFAPEQAETGFVFYPGGRVENTAYAPLLRKLADENILCILLEMPMDLAVLDMYAAEGILEQFPQIMDWYIGGHSLGGSSAAYHLEKTEDSYQGLVLLASYSSVDLQNCGVKVCSVYGSEDGILNMERYQESKNNLPRDFLEYIIEGGNHSQFADYGLQKNDGTAAITGEEQISATAEYLLRFFAD